MVHVTLTILPTGTGRYHSVGVHRVVRVQSGEPIRSDNAVFMGHGDAGSFDSDFLLETHSPHSLPVYLAKNGIDVWGMDYGWTLVPSGETDFTFMANWGLQRDIDDLEAAILFARLLRASTGSDGGRLILLGYSNSVLTGYALLNTEVERSCPLRQIRGFIPLDEFLVPLNVNVQSAICSIAAGLHAQVDQGVYADNSGVFDQQLGSLGLTNPNDPSPFPPYTNQQVLLVIAAAPWQVSGPNPVEQPYGHYIAGKFGPGGINATPTGFRFSPLIKFAQMVATASSYEPVLMEAEESDVSCGNGNPEYSGHLNEVSVPVFHVGAAGGSGFPDLYTLTFLGSKDVSHFIASFYPQDQYALDYGHLDLVLADNAQDVVWSKILHWLQDHQEDNSCSE